jgi:crossover junction endodeoxyribonuclease RuvC
MVSNEQIDFEGKLILGIDPAIAMVGYGLIRDAEVIDYGVIKTTPKQLISTRLNQIYEDVQELCAMHSPDYVAIEMPFFDRKNTNASKVGRALGVIQLALNGAGLTTPIFLHQAQVKSAVAHGRADKKEVQEAVQFLFNLIELPKPDDAADGIAIAYAAQQGAAANID